MKISYFHFLFSGMILFGACRHASTPAAVQLPNHQGDTLALLPNGWKLSPAGTSVPLGDFPMNMVLSHNGKWIAVTNNGQGTQSIELIDVQAEKVSNSLNVAAAWFGLKFSANDQYLYI